MEDPNLRGDKKSGFNGPFGRPTGCATWMIVLIILAFIASMLMRTFGGVGVQETTIPYTTFRSHVEAGNVQSITVSGERIQGELAAPEATEIDGQTTTYSNFVTYFPAFGDEDLFALLQQNNVEVVTQPTQDVAWWAILLNFLPFLLLIGVGYFFLRSARSQGQNAFSFGKSRARLYEREKQRTTFDDVAGAAGAKNELQEIVRFLKDPDHFQRLGGEIPRGVLLVGPPGTGKTLLARAVAGEANVPFFSITGSDFMEMFVGVGASRVRDLFEEARKNAPSIIFIDELDSIGRRRGAGVGGGHDEREQTLNQMLSELDGFERTTSVIVMAATNRPDILDPALLRPGRFDRQVTVDLPTMKDREQILLIHTRNKPLSGDIDLEKVARGTPGFSGADLANLMNEAALLAAGKGKDALSEEDVEEARDKVIMGLKRENLILTEDEYRLLAYHEAGHAVVAAVLPHADPIHKVTIVPRGRAMGVTQQLPERERYIYPRDYIMDRMAVMMGGRAAEQLAMNRITSGAEDDLKQSTRLARRMVLTWGMSKRLGNMALDGDNEEVFLGEDMVRRREYSETTAREVDEEVKAILDEAFKLAQQTLKENRASLDRLAEALLEKEDIPGREVLAILGVQRQVEEVPAAENLV